MTSEPRIVSRSTTRISPWVELIARSVDFGRAGEPETYHAVNQADYVGHLGDDARRPQRGGSSIPAGC